jgi:Protein of unknown function (DUF3089)
MQTVLKDLKLRRIALIAAAGIVALGVAAWVLFQDSFFRMAIHPPGRFAAEAAPRQPDYSKAEAWAVKPSLPQPGGWERPWGVDVFFVHPESAYSGQSWNAAIDQKEASRILAESVLPNHAGPFLRAGPVYAPRYRQASLHSELDVGGEGDGAFLLAYKDVLAAFDFYRANLNRDRGIILAGVGQGGLYVEKLIEDRFQNGPMKDRLVVAYVIDAALPADLPGKAFVQPVCQSHNDIHCVVSWKPAVSAGEANRLRDTSPVWTKEGKIAVSKGRDLVCVNPLSWTTSSELAPRTDHRGGAHTIGASDWAPKIIANAVSARCEAGVLTVERPAAPELQAQGGWGGQHKTPDYNLFYADIVANVVDRAHTGSAWLDENAAKPAEPLPPVLSVEDAPIHRPSGEVAPVQ